MEITVQEREKRKARMKIALVIINCLVLSIGNCGGPLIMRFYFNSGGKRIWFSSFLETAGFPLVLFPLLFSFLLRRKKADRNLNLNSNTSSDNKSNTISISIEKSNSNSNSSSSVDNDSESGKTSFFLMKPRLFMAAAVIGVLTGLDNYLYAYGLAYLPVSTSSLIIAAQLAFTAVFAFFMVKQKFTPFSINAVVLLTVGAGILALNTNGDKPANESHKKYIMGFIMTVAAAVLYAFILPLVELAYKKARQTINYTVVLEIQLVMCAFATAVCAVGMCVNGDFKGISREASESKLGAPMYYVLIVFTSIVWQGFFLGAIGIIFCASSLVSGILISVLLPITEILAVVFFHEKFGSEKAVSLLLSLWGFVSYFYGDMKSQKEEKQQTQQESEMAHLPNP